MNAGVEVVMWPAGFEEYFSHNIYVAPGVPWGSFRCVTALFCRFTNALLLFVCIFRVRSLSTATATHELMAFVPKQAQALLAQQFSPALLHT